MPVCANEMTCMPKKTVHKAVEKRRLALQVLLDSIPEQIDAIKAEKENAAIELRSFVAAREEMQEVKRPTRAWLIEDEKPLEGIFLAANHKTYLSRRATTTNGFSKK